MLHTPLYPQHLALKCRLIPFGEWEMPLHYGSQLEEHHAVRTQAGLFDVSHMMITDLFGKDSEAFLRHLLANDVAKLKPGQALYTCLLNDKAGILDDAIVYFLDDNNYRLISNAGTRNKIQAWLQSQQHTYAVSLQTRHDLAILALQGPASFSLLQSMGLSSLTPETLPSFHVAPFQSGLMARTGYTGELGVEFMLPFAQAHALWEQFIQRGIQPCGLGARDTLRLEMGYSLYGQDMDETTTPFESNLTWTVSLTPDRSFIGKEALEKQRQAGVPRKLIGLILQEQGIPRAHYPVFLGEEKVGEVTSGTFSPSLNKGIALARVDTALTPDNTSLPYAIKIREQAFPATRFRPPFYRSTGVIK
ncbi:MAG: glycine cleavage system aminomethyltransferase GcvT [Gammaproteobacteria bacterium]|nr:glycine cleavage system aminomethyltransferase GcvT [Gammaproteobacteria bacterium]